MRIAGKITLSTIISILLILIIAFFFSGTVISQSKGASRVEAEYNQALEQEYVKSVRSLLSEKGFGNSGVTMTRVIDEDGSREYTVVIHHRRINRLAAEEKVELREECAAIAFPLENCKFYHEFMETDL